MDLSAFCLAGAPTRPASPDARAASAMGSIDPPPSAGPVPSAPRLPDEPIAHRTRARWPFAAERPSQPEPPASEPPAPEPPKLVVCAAGMRDCANGCGALLWLQVLGPGSGQWRVRSGAGHEIRTGHFAET